MNQEDLFRLIGTADETMLAHSEWSTQKKRGGITMKRIGILAAAVFAALSIGVVASAKMGFDPVGLIHATMLGDGVRTTQEEIQAAIEHGEWIGLNGNNVAVIVPESPTRVMLSNDGGETWRESVVDGSANHFIFGEERDDFFPTGGFIGFFGESGGYLVLTGGVAMGNQPVFLYLTDDGGETWREIGNPYDAGEHFCVLTGAGFSTEDIGFISYRYYEDSGPDIWWTSDGGRTWQELTVAMPPEYEGCSFTPGTPTFEGAEGVYPIEVYSSGGAQKTIYMYSSDYGMTWHFA